MLGPDGIQMTENVGSLKGVYYVSWPNLLCRLTDS